MTAAAVDIGTNTVRFLVVGPDQSRDRGEYITGLGQGVDRTGALEARAMDRTVAVLEEAMDRVGVPEQLVVLATSASRDATNRESFFDAVATAIGTRPVLLSGAEEAHLSFRGATAGRRPERHTVVDLGGGSTEVISGVDHPEWVRSFDVGSVRITDRFLRARPASSSDIAKALADIDEIITAVPEPAGSVVGVGGTFQTLGLLLGGRRDGVTLTRHDLAEVVGHLSGLTVDETAAVTGVAPGRAPVLLGGALVAQMVVTRLQVQDLVVSQADLLDGAVAELMGRS